MIDQDKTKAQLISELEELRGRLALLEEGDREGGQAEKALRESEERFRTVADFTYDWEYWRGPDGRFLYVSPSCQRITGYSHEEFMSDSQLLERIIHSDDRKRMSNHFRCETPPSGPFSVEFRIISKAGKERWIEHICQPVFGEDQHWLGQRASNREITDRKQVEKALQESERTLRTLIDASPESILLLDAAGTILLANETVAARLGRPIDQMVGRTPHDVLTAEVAANRMRHFEEVVRTGKPVRFEDQRLDRSVENVIYPILDDQGKIVSVAVLGIDQTDRRRAEEALKKAHDELEERVKDRTAKLQKTNEELAIFHRFAEASSQGFGMADMDGIITYMNPALCRMAGVATSKGAIGTHIREYYPESYMIRRDTEIIPAMLKAGHWEGELVISPTGKTTHLLQHSFLIRDEKGEPLCLASVITDITERKRAEEALRESHDELRAIYDGIQDGLTVEDIEAHRIVRMNASLCQMLGYSDEELRDKELENVHPAGSLAAIKEAYRAHVEGRVIRSEAVPFIRKDGSIFHADISSSRIVYNGRPSLICFFHDITERKQAQEALERERQSLWHMLRASDHERQTISYEIHDDLAQYLAGAGMHLQSYDAIKGSSPEKAKKEFGIAVELVRQAHFDARRLISEIRPLVIDEAGVETAISHLVYDQRRHGGPEIKFDSHVQFGRLPSILEDSLYRIAQEALTNACKHSKSEKVTVTLAQENQDVRLEVQDWGRGFDPESVEKSRFGLEGIRQRVRLLGGRLTIESKLGAGTLVQAVVPIVERKAAE